jgi:hypothetical protein
MVNEKINHKVLKINNLKFKLLKNFMKKKDHILQTILLNCILLSFHIVYSQNKNNTHYSASFDSIELLSKQFPNKGFLLAKKMYLSSSRTKDELQKVQSLYLIGTSIGNMNKYSEALKYLYYAKNEAKKIDNDSLTLYCDFSIAIQYGRLNFNQKAIELIDKCFENTHSIIDSDNKNVFIANLYSFKAFFLAGTKPEPSYWLLLNYHKKAALYLNKVKKKNISNFAYTNIGMYYQLLNENEKALNYYTKSLQEAKSNKSVSLEIVYHNIGNVYYLQKEYQKSIKYIDSSIDLAKPKKIYYILKDNYSLQKDNYRKLGNYTKGNLYANLEASYADSLNHIEKTEYIKGTNLILEKLEKEKKDSDRKSIVLIMVSFFIILSIFIVYLITVKKQKIKNKLKEENITIKSKEINELKQKVSTSYQEVIEMAKKDNPLFVSFFKELYPEFYAKLIKVQPKLTITEQKVCFFIKLKFSTKEIANYTYVSIKAIQNRKNRLRKRLGLENGEDLYEWIEKL